jgi:cyclophilin family peptidyl-prolyl cis-trans isomerase
MNNFLRISLLTIVSVPTFTHASQPEPPPVPASQTLLEKSQKSDWRTLDPENTVYLELLNGGRVVIELAPAFAPNTISNIKALIRENYFDISAILRSQDNFVVQWGHPEDAPRESKYAKKTIKAEFESPIEAAKHFTALTDPDTYAAQVGFSQGFPVAKDPTLGKAWLVHCYAMVGVGRDTAADSGSGAELYAVNGHSPRQLDRNVTIVGRVVHGMELLSTLTRGKALLDSTRPRQSVQLSKPSDLVQTCQKTSI